MAERAFWVLSASLLQGKWECMALCLADFRLVGGSPSLLRTSLVQCCGLGHDPREKSQEAVSGALGTLHWSAKRTVPVEQFSVMAPRWQVSGQSSWGWHKWCLWKPRRSGLNGQQGYLAGWWLWEPILFKGEEEPFINHHFWHVMYESFARCHYPPQLRL